MSDSAFGKAMTRIGLFLAIEPTWGGAFQYDLAILDAMAQLPNGDIEVVVCYSHDAWLPYLERYGFRSVLVPLGYWARFFAQLIHCSGTSLTAWRSVASFFHPTIRCILKERCDLWIFPSQDPWCYLAPVPAIATIHDLMHRYERRFPEIGTRWQYAWREWHFRNTCKWASGILVDSELGKQHVVDSYGVDSTRLYVLPFIAPAYIDDVEIIKNSDLTRRLPKKFLFYPAQFWEHKNHKRLVRAVGSLKQRFPDITLVLTGAKKNIYPAILAFVEQMGLHENILFLDYVSDDQMGILYRHARAMVMPSFCGPTNIPPLEAMKMGCPCAVSNIYAMPEQTKGAALLFDPESVDDIAAVIARLWEDDKLCQEMAECGRIVSSEWTATHFNALFGKILMDVLSRIRL